MHSSNVILLATLRAILTSACIALIGVASAWKGYITPQGRKSLLDLSMNVLMPALLFTNVVACQGEYLRCVPWSRLMQEAWVLLFFPLVVVSSGLLLGKLTAVATGCPRGFVNGCAGAVAFANSTGMSVALLGVLSPGLISSGVLDKDPLEFQPFYLVLYPILQWGVGARLFNLSLDGGEKPKDSPHWSSLAPAEEAKAATSANADAVSPANDVPTTAAPRVATVVTTGEAPPRADGDGDEEMGVSSQSSSSSVAANDKCGTNDDLAAVPTTERLCTRAFKNAKTALRYGLVPPVCGALLGVLVAMITPGREVLDGHRPYLEPMFRSLVLVGRCSGPANMLVLGAGLAQGANLRSIPLRTNFGIALMKMLIQPALMTGVIFVFARVITCNQAVWLVMIIMSSTPTANNIMVMVEMSGKNEDAMRACVLVQYLLAPILLPIVLTSFLMLLSTPGFLP